MHTNICEPNDDAAIARLEGALRSLGAGLLRRYGAMGVDVYRLRIGLQEAVIYSDSWSVDIEGPEELVRPIIAAVAATT